MYRHLYRHNFNGQARPSNGRTKLAGVQRRPRNHLSHQVGIERVLVGQPWIGSKAGLRFL